MDERIRGTTLDIEPQLGSMAVTPTVQAPRGMRLDFWNATGSSQTVSLAMRNGTKVGPLALPSGGTLCFSGDLISSITGVVNGSLFWAIVGMDTPFTWPTSGVNTASGQPVNLTKVNGVTLTNVGPLLEVGNGVYGSPGVVLFLAPTSYATQAETVEATSTSVPVGTVVFFSIAMLGPLTTVADVLTYVAIKGATSGTYYAACGPLDSATGSFVMAASEDLTIVVRNQDTTSHGAVAALEAPTA
jgi:hypothetical protein